MITGKVGLVPPLKHTKAAALELGWGPSKRLKWSRFGEHLAGLRTPLQTRRHSWPQRDPPSPAQCLDQVLFRRFGFGSPGAPWGLALEGCRGVQGGALSCFVLFSQSDFRDD